MFSPYQWNPNNKNALKEMLEELIDFSVLQKSRSIRLFICATNVLTGRLKVFENREITPDMIMASACLPYLTQAPEIDGQYYWDGGYMGNPPIFPVIYDTDCRDVLIVQINPINIPEVPRTTNEIFDRINTLSFNSSLMREMRAIYFITSLIEKGELDSSKHKHTFIHTIDAEEVMAKLSASRVMSCPSPQERMAHCGSRTRKRMRSGLSRNPYRFANLLVPDAVESIASGDSTMSNSSARTPRWVSMNLV
jgi:NTE family protein